MHVPTRWLLFGEFGRSESNCIVVGRGPRAKIMGKLGPCGFEMGEVADSIETRLSPTQLTTLVGVKV